MHPKKLIRRAVALMAANGLKPIERDGKLEYETLQKSGGNWIYIAYHPTNNCTLWHTFMYCHISRELRDELRFIPTPCMDCYKVVARPSTYKDFLNLYEDMKAHLPYPSKLGTEMRDDVDALFGAYWYCRGLEEGFERLDQVRDATGLDAILKRGCTEYELRFGPSDKWKVHPEQEAVEQEVFKRVHIDNYKRPQTPEEIAEIMATWERFANEVGPDYEPSHFYVTYEREHEQGRTATA